MIVLLPFVVGALQVRVALALPPTARTLVGAVGTAPQALLVADDGALSARPVCTGEWTAKAGAPVTVSNTKAPVNDTTMRRARVHGLRRSACSLPDRPYVPGNEKEIFITSAPLLGSLHWRLPRDGRILHLFEVGGKDLFVEGAVGDGGAWLDRGSRVGGTNQVPGQAAPESFSIATRSRSRTKCTSMSSRS